MTNVNAYIQTFAGGEFGEAMSARVSIDSYQAACELMENWMPLAQGVMTRRPSLEFINSFVDSSLIGVLHSFEFDVGQNYLILVQSGIIYFYLNDGILDIDTVTASISNGSFSSFTGWTDNSQTGASASAANGYLNLISNGVAKARARTTFTINESDTGHILAFDVINGPVTVSVGTSAGDGTYLHYSGLKTGHHRLEFTPIATGTGHLQFSNETGAPLKLVDNVEILTGTSVFTLPAPWASDDLRGVFTDQDGDRLNMFHRSYPSRVLERRGHRSWSLIYFEPDDGPFDVGDDAIRLSPSAEYGTCTITSDETLFQSSDERRLLRIAHQGQYVREIANDDGIYSDSIKVSGIGVNRNFTAAVSGSFTGTVTLERSIGNENDFSKVITVTAATSNVYNDAYQTADSSGAGSTSDAVYNVSGATDGLMNNQTVFYRWNVKIGDHGSGTITMTLSTDSGSQTGVARIIEYTNGTTVNVEVLSHFAKAGASDIWDIGSWNDVDEWPNVVTFAHGRLWAFRRRQLWSSVSDDYFSFQDGTDADQSIQLTLRSKSAEGVRWARELDFLCIGTRNEEYVLRSTSAAEPVGPTTAETSLQGEEGGAAVAAAVAGDSIIFNHRNERRVMQFAHNPRALSADSFVAVDLTRLNPEAVEDGIVNTVVQQEPERRVFSITKAGIAKPALFRREEEIMGWQTMTTMGLIEDACVLREAKEDAVYFIVRRYIGSAWVRMIEKLRTEIILNDEDLVHLDSMLETSIERPDVGITPDSINVGAVTVTATDDVFEVGDVGKIIWNNGGQISIDAYVDAQTITGTVVYPLRGKLDYISDQVNGRPVYNPEYIPPGRWGMATPTSSVSGLSHLEGETVHIWADMAYRGTATVASGAVTLPGTYSRVFVGLNFTSVWKSLKQAYGGGRGTAINQPKRVTNMGLLLSRTADCVVFGDTPGRLKRLIKASPPALLGGSPRYFTGEAYEAFDGTFDPDPRIIIGTVNPGPATIKAIIPNIQTNDRPPAGR